MRAPGLISPSTKPRGEIMRFTSFILTPDGEIAATAIGHPTEVITAFRSVSFLLLSPIGPWRITKVRGAISDHTNRDSDMVWELRAKTK